LRKKISLGKCFQPAPLLVHYTGSSEFQCKIPDTVDNQY
jgi:hypothetical protein